MIHKELMDRICLAVKSAELGNEICNRLRVTTPANREEALSILMTLNPDLNDRISDSLKACMGNYDHGECGYEIAEKINGCIEVLQVYYRGGSVKESKRAMGDDLMTKITLEALTLALSSIDLAQDFELLYDSMIASVQNIGQSPEEFKTVSKKMEVAPVIEKQQVVRKRIRLKRV